MNQRSSDVGLRRVGGLACRPAGERPFQDGLQQVLAIGHVTGQKDSQPEQPLTGSVDERSELLLRTFDDAVRSHAPIRVRRPRAGLPNAQIGARYRRRLGSSGAAHHPGPASGGNTCHEPRDAGVAGLWYWSGSNRLVSARPFQASQPHRPLDSQGYRPAVRIRRALGWAEMTVRHDVLAVASVLPLVAGASGTPAPISKLLLRLTGVALKAGRPLAQADRWPQTERLMNDLLPAIAQHLPAVVSLKARGRTVTFTSVDPRFSASMGLPGGLDLPQARPADALREVRACVSAIEKMKGRLPRQTAAWSWPPQGRFEPELNGAALHLVWRDINGDEVLRLPGVVLGQFARN